MKSKNSKTALTPFTYSKSILSSRTEIPVSQEYSSYVINRAVAHHRDCIFICQSLNEISVDPQQHYAYLFNRVAKYNRPFEKWVSANQVDQNASDLNLIAKYYQCSIEIAEQYLALMGEESLNALRVAYGGKEPRASKQIGKS